ncbi:MAG: hypothetical protein ACLS6O_01545 [Bifidobacterium sp.]
MVSAIYKIGDTETLRKLIDPTDGDLKFTGFDSATAGTNHHRLLSWRERDVRSHGHSHGGHSRPESSSPAIPTIGNTAKPGNTATNKPVANGAAPFEYGCCRGCHAVVVVVLAAAAGAARHPQRRA